MSETREQAVERLKKNEKHTILADMPEGDQKIIRGVGSQNLQRLGRSSETCLHWFLHATPPATNDIEICDIYRIRPDYHEEPAKPEDKCEKVYGENGMLFVNVPGMYGRCLIESLVHYEDFRGFFYKTDRGEPETFLEEIARRMAEGKLVVAKFEKGK